MFSFSMAMAEIERLTGLTAANPLDFSSWTVAGGTGGLLGLLEKQVSPVSMCIQWLTIRVHRPT
jgi:hypothetical protein